MLLAVPAFAAWDAGKGVHSSDDGHTRSGHRCSDLESLKCAVRADIVACSIDEDPLLEQEGEWGGLTAQMCDAANGDPRQPLHAIV
jgi:hypothetical protein